MKHIDKIKSINGWLGSKSWLIAFIFVSLMSTTSLFAQQVVTGKVTDKQGEPIAGVMVHEKEMNAVITNLSGEYRIEVEEEAELTFSSIGFESQTEKVGNRTIINIVMGVKDMALDEVVVIGYGTIKKKDLTGAVSVVNPETLADRANVDIAAALKGVAPGVQVTTSGLAGDLASITIRGTGNLTNNEPLYVIDGVPSGRGLHFNMNDIESIQVLKDASAAAIYGSRSANGVVIITTKKGSEGPMRVEFSAQLTTSRLPKYKLMNASQYIKYNDMAYEEAIRSGVDGITQRQDHRTDVDTDWQDEMLKTGIIQNYNVSLSGGKKEGRYYVSLNRMKDGGTMKHTGYEKYGFRVNTSGEKGIFSFGQNLQYHTSKRDVLQGNPFGDFIGMAPTIPLYDENNPGGFGYGDPHRANTYASNPIAQQKLYNQRNDENSLQANIFGKVTLFKMLTAELNIAYNNYDGTTNSLRKTGNWTQGQGSDRAHITKDNYKSRNFVLEHIYTFDHKFGKHDINAVFGISYENYKGEKHYTTALDPLVINDKYITSINSATGKVTGGSHVDESRLISYLGRINYSFDDKYLFSATFRRDGSSRLSPSGRWANFPSVSVGWRISQENFFNSGVIDDLKIRGSFGSLGGGNVGFYDYLAVINTAPRAILGDPDQIHIGMTQSRIVNENVKWERREQINIGFDMAMLNNRLTVSADYFNAKSKDILVYLPILLTTGNAGGNPLVNAGSMRNSGVEFDIGWRDNVNKDFSYGVAVNVAHIKNKVLSLGYGQDRYHADLSRTDVGRSLGSFFLYRTLGIFQSYEEVMAHTNAEGVVIQPDARPGDIKFDDFNGDGVINANDRQFVGSPWPKLEMGVTLTAQYKNFDFLLNAHGRFGHKIWNGAKAMAGDMAHNYNLFRDAKPWTAENRSNSTPRVVFGDSKNSIRDQDRWLESGSFLRIGEIAFGYNLPKHICNKMLLENLRVGVTLQNMVTITGYSGLDPDFRDGGIFTRSADYCSYPNPRSVIFSLTIGF